MNNPPKPDYTSRVPRYTFANTLAEQQAQLAANPMLERFQQSRQRLASDPYRPLYHFVSPESGLNDPNGLCFWQGNWHLFYQTNPPEEPGRPHWGHAISTDLIHWRDLPHAIHPNPERMSFSGATLVEEDRVIAIYHGVGVGNMVAVAGDPLLLNWEKLTGQAVIPEPCEMWNTTTGKEITPGLLGNPVPAGAINFMYDPCLWKKNGFYYSLSGGILPHAASGKRTRAEFLFRSQDLQSWEYLHSFIEGDRFGEIGDDGGCPYFWPIGDRHLLLHYSHRTGGKYILGDYDTRADKFIATAGGSFTFGSYFPGGVHAPSATPDGKGGVIAIFNINMAKPTPGWDQIMSLPRRLTLIGKDDLGVEPAGAIESLRGEQRSVAPRTLPANQEIVLDSIRGNALEIILEIDPKNAPMIELDVLRSPGREEFTRICFFKQRGYRNWERAAGSVWDQNAIDSLLSIDTSRSSQLPDVLSRAPETAPFYLAPGENLKLRVFIDKSVLEVFVNGRQCATVRVYPGHADSLGVSLLAQGQPAELLRFDAWQMQGIDGKSIAPRQKNTNSLRVHYRTWSDKDRCREQLELLREFRGTIDEVAFFTSDTHPPLPLTEVRRRAALLQSIIPDYKALGLHVGINHLATIGHLDENPENSLNEPWQHLVDKSGAVSASCYCAADPAVQTYIRECYAALAAAGPEFIWIDDDVRLEHHPNAISFACFCPFCLAEFGAETNAAWTREGLLAGLKESPVAQRLELRRRWLEHSRQYVARILRLARAGTDSVTTNICLGLMTGEAVGGYGYEVWTAALAGVRKREVKFRPGGGFYTDDNPLALLGKCHGVGRQNAFVPVAVTDIQYEHENFPYIVLNKSRATFLAEMTGAIAAGCTGVAFNTLGISGDPLEEFRLYFDTVKNARPFFDELVATCGRSSCDGIWTAFGLDHNAALGPDGEWPGPGSWGGDFHAVNELFTLGLPPAYTRAGATLTILTGDNVLEWSREQLRELFSGGVLLDGPALQRLAELGLADWAGFEIIGTRQVDTIERFTADPLNGRFAGWHRDCRPSFWQRSTQLLRPMVPTARLLAECHDFTPKNYGGCAGVFENQVGGRVAVFGYYPWTMLGSLAKTTQLRNVTRWLSRDRLPAYVESHQRISLWCRRDAAGRPVFVLINASIDPAEGVVLKARDLTGTYQTLNWLGEKRCCTAADIDGPYRSLRLPPVAPWSALLVRAAEDSQ